MPAPAARRRATQSTKRRASGAVLSALEASACAVLRLASFSSSTSSGTSWMASSYSSASAPACSSPSLSLKLVDDEAVDGLPPPQLPVTTPSGAPQSATIVLTCLASAAAASSYVFQGGAADPTGCRLLLTVASPLGRQLVGRHLGESVMLPGRTGPALQKISAVA